MQGSSLRGCCNDEVLFLCARRLIQRLSPWCAQLPGVRPGGRVTFLYRQECNQRNDPTPSPAFDQSPALRVREGGCGTRPCGLRQSSPTRFAGNLPGLCCSARGKGARRFAPCRGGQGGGQHITILESSELPLPRAGEGWDEGGTGATEIFIVIQRGSKCVHAGAYGRKD